MRVAVLIDLSPEMTADQLMTLQNFNPCVVSTVPQLSAPSTACPQFGGNAEFDLTAVLIPLDTTVTLLKADNTVAATSEGNTLSAPAGTYTVQFNYGNCVVKGGSVTVTCPAEVPVRPSLLLLRPLSLLLLQQSTLPPVRTPLRLLLALLSL